MVIMQGSWPIMAAIAPIFGIADRTPTKYYEFLLGQGGLMLFLSKSRTHNYTIEGETNAPANAAIAGFTVFTIINTNLQYVSTLVFIVVSLFTIWVATPNFVTVVNKGKFFHGNDIIEAVMTRQLSLKKLTEKYVELKDMIHLINAAPLGHSCVSG